MQITQEMPDLRYLRQHRLIRNTLIGSIRWLQSKLPDHAIQENIVCENGEYKLSVNVELLDADLMALFDRQRQEAKAKCGSVGNISLKAEI